MRRFPGCAFLLAVAAHSLVAAEPAARGQLHIPVGVPDQPDTLKTFVEPDGSFSPGFGTFGVSFRLAENNGGPVLRMEATPEHGLRGGGLLIPWCKIAGG